MRTDIFGDDRKIPKLTINVKVKVKTISPEETVSWNKVFGYIMKKPRTKLEFMLVNNLRKIPIQHLTLQKITPYITATDVEYLQKVEDLFNNRLPLDVKAFILAILHISTDKASILAQQQEN